MRITIYTTTVDLPKIANEQYDSVQWSVLNNRQLIEGIPNVQIQVDFETYIRLQDARSDNKHLITG